MSFQIYEYGVQYTRIRVCIILYCTVHCTRTVCFGYLSRSASQTATRRRSRCAMAAIAASTRAAFGRRSLRRRMASGTARCASRAPPPQSHASASSAATCSTTSAPSTNSIPMEVHIRSRIRGPHPPLRANLPNEELKPVGTRIPNPPPTPAQKKAQTQRANLMFSKTN